MYASTERCVYLLKLIIFFYFDIANAGLLPLGGVNINKGGVGKTR